jgi:hypothetical protein
MKLIQLLQEESNLNISDLDELTKKDNVLSLLRNKKTTFDSLEQGEQNSVYPALNYWVLKNKHVQALVEKLVDNVQEQYKELCKLDKMNKESFSKAQDFLKVLFSMNTSLKDGVISSATRKDVAKFLASKSRLSASTIEELNNLDIRPSKKVELKRHVIIPIREIETSSFAKNAKRFEFEINQPQLWFETSEDVSIKPSEVQFTISYKFSPEEILFDSNLFDELAQTTHSKRSFCVRPGTYRVTVEDKQMKELKEDGESFAKPLRALKFPSFTPGELLSDKAEFKKLVTNSTTTELLHQLSDVIDFIRTYLEPTHHDILEQLPDVLLYKSAKEIRDKFSENVTAIQQTLMDIHVNQRVLKDFGKALGCPADSDSIIKAFFRNLRLDVPVTKLKAVQLLCDLMNKAEQNRQLVLMLNEIRDTLEQLK